MHKEWNEAKVEANQTRKVPNSKYKKPKIKDWTQKDDKFNVRNKIKLEPIQNNSRPGKDLREEMWNFLESKELGEERVVAAPIAWIIAAI